MLPLHAQFGFRHEDAGAYGECIEVEGFECGHGTVRDGCDEESVFDVVSSQVSVHERPHEGEYRLGSVCEVYGE